MISKPHFQVRQRIAGILLISCAKYRSETEEEGVDWKEFAEKVKDILEDIEDAIEDAANTEGTSSATSARGWTSTITSSAGTELDGALGGTAHATTITTSFDPSQPSEACEAWESLWNYCSGAQSGAACACYSGTFYVPDQWDLLASRCGRYSCTDSAKYPDENYCALSKTASDFTSYCSNLNSATSAKFAAVAATATSATPGSTTTSSSVAQTGSASAAAGDDGINIGLGAAALLCLLTAVYIA